ncbi:MAG: polysaccharide deacetylase family protein [Acidobacteriota bacterium]
MNKKRLSINNFARHLNPISYFTKFIQSLSSSKRDFRTIFLTYHSISKYRDQTKNFYYTISPELFNAQMKYLYDHNFKIINLSHWHRLQSKQDSSLNRSIVLTFDDGYADSFFYAYPVLKKHGFSATFFLICEFIDSKNIFPWLQEPKFLNNENLPLSSKQIIQMDKDGMDFGSHTLSHKDLTQISQEEAWKEIKGSKEYLEDLLGHDIISFSYPYGSWSNFNASTTEMLKKAGYKMALTSIYGSNSLQADLYSLKRIPVYADDDLTKFGMKCQGHYNWMGRLQKLMFYASNLLKLR